MINKKCSVTRCVCVAMVALATTVSQQVTAVDLSLTSVYGIDSNPHKLSDEELPEQQEFIYGEFDFSGNYREMFYADANVSKAQYLNDERADWFKSNFDLALKSKFKIYEREFGYAFGANYASYDKTYVSKLTGLVGTFGGQSIADRYDSTVIDYNLSLSYQTQQNTTFSFLFQQSDKEYEEISIPDLSNLDYSHQRFGFNVDYKTSDSGRYFAEASVTVRDYLDRRAKDLDGVNIENTDLSFDYSEFLIGYDYHPEEDVSWKYTFRYSKRADNNSGFWNADSGYLSIATKYTLADYHILSANLEFSRFSYENEPIISLTSIDEENSDHQGFSLKLDYQWIMATLYSTKLGLYIALESSVFDSLNQEYTYQENSLSAGIRWDVF